jgi:hypothetical protein
VLAKWPRPPISRALFISRPPRPRQVASIDLELLRAFLAASFSLAEAPGSHRAVLAAAAEVDMRYYSTAVQHQVGLQVKPFNSAIKENNKPLEF